MKSCQYCGAANEDDAERCAQCAAHFSSPDDPALVDPQSTLVILATVPDLTLATLIKDELEAAGIIACIPEDLGSNLFGNIIALTSVTIRVAARDYDRAKQAMADLFPHESD